MLHASGCNKSDLFVCALQKNRMFIWHRGCVMAITKAAPSAAVQSTALLPHLLTGIGLIWNRSGRGDVLYIFTSKMLKFIYANQWRKKNRSS